MSENIVLMRDGSLLHLYSDLYPSTLYSSYIQLDGQRNRYPLACCNFPSGATLK